MDSSEDTTFYTVTMARVYADQGRYEAAARIYRYLLDQTPDRSDLKQALDAVLAKLPEAPRQWGDVAGLVEHWIDLMLRFNALRRLRQTCLPTDRLQR
jgi:tetratricopeptide (TPR) repeat protein